MPNFPKTELLDKAKALRKLKGRRLAFEAAAMSVATLTELTQKLPPVTLVPTTGQVEQLRAVKDREEIAAIRRAIACAERAFRVLQASLRPEQTEVQVAADLEYQIRQFGGRGCSFPTIVAAGRRSALSGRTGVARARGRGDSASGLPRRR